MKLLHENDITNIATLASMSPNEMKDVIASASPPLKPGLKIQLVHLHEEAVQTMGWGKTPGGSIDVDKAVSKISSMEAQLFAQAQLLDEHSKETKREFDAMKKKTAGIKMDKQRPGSGGGGGGLVQIQANEADDMHHSSDSCSYLDARTIAKKFQYLETASNMITKHLNIDESVIVHVAEEQGQRKADLFSGATRANDKDK